MTGSKIVKADEPVENSRSPSPTKKTVIESRRAEQNRAAQRAFRQRKELYVKELEAKVNSMADWPARMEQLENENESLKRKIAELMGSEETSQQQNNKKPFVQAAPAEKSSCSTTSSNKMTRAKTTSPQPTTTSPSIITATKVGGEKGKVLDDLVSILRTRNRPPIPPN